MKEALQGILILGAICYGAYKVCKPMTYGYYEQYDKNGKMRMRKY